VYAATAVPYYEYTEDARLAYDLIFSLEFDEAQRVMTRIKVEEPENLVYHTLRNYIDCLALFIGEQSIAYEKLKSNKLQRLELLKEGDRSSPYYLYAQADIYIQWAITRVKFEDYFQAVLEVKRAFTLLKRNQERFPDFMPNQKNLGLMHALIGTVPDSYRWTVQILGMEGTIEQGKREIEEVLAHARHTDFIFEKETEVMYAYLLLHLANEKEKAWEVISQARIQPKDNPLACFVMANIAMQTKRNVEAISILENRPRGKQYLPVPYLDFMLGVAKLNQLDAAADQHLQSFLEQTRGRHYIKEAYQKLAWNALIHHGEDRYRKYMEACKVHGMTSVDEDQAALQEARSGIVPNRELLIARVLSDGGYHQRALEHMQGFGAKDMTQKRHRIEYHYRLGRINHALEHTESALQAYQRTIDEGEHEAYYFACNAAVLSGNILEQTTRDEEAATSYQRALSMRPDEYKLGLHQKAKAGLNRLASRSLR